MKNRYNVISEGEKEKMDADYKKAIDILLLVEDIDWKLLGAEFAKNYPDLFVKCYERTKNTKPAWEQQVIKYIKEHPGDKIGCIKYCRTLTNKGLAESKQFVDQHWSTNG